MTSRQRFVALMEGRKADRPGVGYISALTCRELQERTGCWMPEVHHDPEKLVRLCGACHDVLGFDFVTFLINFFNEPAALGCEMDWGAADRYPMYLSHPWAERAEVRVEGDFLDRPGIGGCLETIRLAKIRYGRKCGVLGKVMGPLSMVQVMVGVETAMMQLIEEPRRIGHLLEVAVEMLVPFANAQLEMGADAVSIGEGGAGTNMLSPEMYEEVLMDVHRRMIGAIKGPTIMHICGDITPRLGSLRKIGLDFFHFDWAIGAAKMVRAAGGEFGLIGNIGTGELLRGTPEIIGEQVKACRAAGVEMIAPGCATSPTCPMANLAAMVEAVEGAV